MRTWISATTTFSCDSVGCRLGERSGQSGEATKKVTKSVLQLALCKKRRSRLEIPAHHTGTNKPQRTGCLLAKSYSASLLSLDCSNRVNWRSEKGNEGGDKGSSPPSSFTASSRPGFGSCALDVGPLGLRRFFSVSAMTDILSLVRSTCREAVASSDVAIDDDAIEAFAAAIVKESPASLSPPQVGLPLRFDSVDEELNTMFLLQLINIGSGFREPLHGITGAGAWDTILRGVLGMHIAGIRPTADSLSDMDITKIEACFGFPTTYDAPIPDLPIARQTKPGPLHPFAKHLVKLMTEAGAALRNRGCEDFAAFCRQGAKMEEALDKKRREERGESAGESAEEAPWRPSVAAFVQRLVDSFPGFNDVHILDRGDGNEPLRVFILKKAQLAAAHLSQQFASRIPEVFGFDKPDLDRLTIMSDNVVPAVLRAVGILKYSEALAAGIDGTTTAATPTPTAAAAEAGAGKSGGAGSSSTAADAAAAPPKKKWVPEGFPVAGSSQEIDIRAGAVVACEKLVAAIRRQGEAEVARLKSGDGDGVDDGDAAAKLSRQRLEAFLSRDLNEASLDEYLWTKGKEEAFRKLRRHYTRGTYYY